ncbi:MAG: hypothetical protein Q7S57_01705 [bacterium]|nr:hypothetical protein [bacterium]
MADKYRQLFNIVLSVLVLFSPALAVHAGCDPVCPVVIVPGMLASFDKKLMYQDKEDNKWGFVWGGNVYKALINELKARGFEEGKTLFIAHYDWRKPVSENWSKYLKPKIDEAKRISGQDHVDLVAHSMGGLLSRAYIQNDSYGHDVNKLVMMGTPNYGASDAYVVWEGGLYPQSWNYFYKSFFNNIQWSLKRTRNKKDILPPLSFREFFPSIKDLLPTVPFVRDGAGMVTLSEMKDKNDFLINLNNNIAVLKSHVGDNTRIYYGLTGKTMGEITVNPVDEQADATLARWRDGHPIPDPPVANSTQGDETVLVASAGISEIDDFQLEGTSHIKIPDDARFTIPWFINPPIMWYLPQPFRALAQNLLITPFARADGDEYVAPDSMLSFTVSPNVAFEVTDPDGKLLSRTENQLGEDNANFDDDPSDPDDIILVTIRNPKVGKYTLKISGNTAGDYYVDSTYVNNNGVFDESKEGVIGMNEVKTVDETVSETDGVKIGEKIGDAVVAIQKILVTLLDKKKANDPSIIKGDYEKLDKPLSDLRNFLSDFEEGLLKEKKNKPVNYMDKVDDLRNKFAYEVDKIIGKEKISQQTIEVLLEMKRRLLGATLR